MFVEVESNPNCETSLFLRFKEIGPAKAVVKVRIFDRTSQGEWCWVTGWTDDPDRPRGPAYAQRVEDSGAGASFLVFGGLWGLRLKPVSLEEEWDLDSSNQWGEAYLSLADERDMVYAEH